MGGAHGVGGVNGEYMGWGVYMGLEWGGGCKWGAYRVHIGVQGVEMECPGCVNGVHMGMQGG